MKQKGVCAYEYMNDWKEINETWLPEKEDFYSHLNMENITDADYAHPKEFLKILQKIWTCKYHDLYVQSDTLLLADVFENLYICIIWNIYFNIFELNPTKFISVPVLAWQEALKKDYSKIRSFNWHGYVIMVGKGIRGGICHSIYPHAKANNKFMKDYDKIKESWYIEYWDVNSLYGWKILQSFQ